MMKLKLRGKILSVVILTIVLICGIFTYYIATTLRHNLEYEVEENLENVVETLIASFNSIDNGDYILDDTGNLYKGDYLLNVQLETMEHIREERGLVSTIFYGDTRVLTTIKNDQGEYIIGTKASDKVVDSVLDNKTNYFDTNINIEGEEYYGYYIPLINGNEVVGMLFAGKESAQTNQMMTNTRNTFILLEVILQIVLITLVSVILTKMTKGLKQVTKSLVRLSEGDLTVELDGRLMEQKDEIGEICNSANKLRSSLANIVGDIASTTKKLGESSKVLDQMADITNRTTGEVSRAIEEISQGAVSQAEDAQNATSSVNEMGLLITNIVQDVEHLNHQSDRMGIAEQEASNIIRELNQSNEQTTKAVEKIAEQTTITNESVNAIRQAIEMITTISHQTNLLSLNASIEAARAGDAGRGFGVVALEIQKLADQSNASAKKINEVIENLIGESNKTVDIMKEVQDIVLVQEEKLAETRDKFEDVKNGIESSLVGVKKIEGQAIQLDVFRQNIIQVIENLSALAQENAAATEETMAASEELKATMSELENSADDLEEYATELEKNIKRFTLS